MVEVLNVKYSNFNKCTIINYKDTDKIVKLAACIEHLAVKIGDFVEIYSDDYVNYHGIGAMALKVVSQKQKNANKGTG